MHIYLFDLENQKNVKLELAVEYTVPATDLFVVFYSKEQTAQLSYNKESTLYDEYFFKKVNHIAGATTHFEGHKYSLTVGFYLDNNELVPFLIDHRGTNDYKKFDTSPIHNEQYFTRFQLFNYKEYMELAFLLGLEKLEFKDFITRLINGQLDKNQLTLYNISPSITDNFNDFLTNKQFEVFLDEEEKNEA
ncbi:hypothetical protein [Parasediminibacterium sp. JCM 36343]|uniref:hypothetical protein n=1 Tax=Parasediminibacterium sp. JCM 36343 TaxID=3374279 RepID=UPI00397BDFBA